MTRTELINALIERFGYTRYLEIGVFHPEMNLAKIQAPTRVGVDPDPDAECAYCMASEVFFDHARMVGLRFDIVFVDGLHYADVAFRDIKFALEILARDGIIVVHDCNPQSEGAQAIPRSQKLWNGDVWKAWVRLRAERDDLELFVVDCDEGCGVIRYGEQKPIDIDSPLEYRCLEENRKVWLNLKTVSEFNLWLEEQPRARRSSPLRPARIVDDP
jgi:hypothetical protein